MVLLTVSALIHQPMATVWNKWTTAEHIKNWNFANADWHCPEVINNLVEGGEFHYTMAAKDNSMSFDFCGTYQTIEFEKHLDILLGDNRKMKVTFESSGAGTLVTEQFEPEKDNSNEMQQAGWQMILDNFKKYVEK